MTGIDLRKDDRRPLERRPDGLLLLKTPLITYPINEIKDISSSGICIHLGQRVDAPTEIAIEYIAAGIKMEVNGIVAWCVPRQGSAAQPTAAGGFTLGIELFSPVLLFAMCEDH